MFNVPAVSSVKTDNKYTSRITSRNAAGSAIRFAVDSAQSAHTVTNIILREVYVTYYRRKER